jgi:hypothetical protein
VLDASGRQPADAERLAAVSTAAREAECGKYLDAIDQEIATGKLTLAELDEEEQSLERLRRWHPELRLRCAGRRLGGWSRPAAQGPANACPSSPPRSFS